MDSDLWPCRWADPGGVHRGSQRPRRYHGHAEDPDGPDAGLTDHYWGPDGEQPMRETWKQWAVIGRLDRFNITERKPGWFSCEEGHDGLCELHLPTPSCCRSPWTRSLWCHQVFLLYVLYVWNQHHCSGNKVFIFLCHREPHFIQHFANFCFNYLENVSHWRWTENQKVEIPEVEF